MEMSPFESSNIEAIGYDPETQEMHVRFKDGATYAYSNVPPGAHQQLIQARSVGSHFHQHIKGRFTHRKL
jgi:KTSC domain